MKIKVKSLKTTKVSENALESGYLYKDIALDLTSDVSYNSQLNRTEYLNDVSALYDVEAVKNSVATACLTSPGDKILNPTYGIDLRRHLFDPVDDFTADIIQEELENKLPEMEPRITVENVTVVANEDDQEYEITLQINVPSLDINGLSIKSKLNSVGYTII